MAIMMIAMVLGGGDNLHADRTLICEQKNEGTLLLIPWCLPSFLSSSGLHSRPFSLTNMPRAAWHAHTYIHT